MRISDRRTARQFRAFLDAKLRHDPDERFQSDWYRHYKQLLA
jgi:hypothetical protein